MLAEINPLIVTPDGEVKALDSKFTVDDSALYRHPDIAEFRDTSAADPLEALRAREGRHLREARRLGRDPRQRRRALDVDGRRRRRRRRQAGELLRPRRRRQRGGCRRRARGDHARPAGEVDLLQHLRRDHALRRGRARHPRGARPDEDRASRSSSASTARTRRRAGRSSPTPRRRTCTSSRRCSTRRRRPWSSLRERTSGTSAPRRYRTSAVHAAGPRSRPRRRDVRRRGPGRRCSTSRPAAATSRGGCASAGAEVVTVDPLAGHAAGRDRAGRASCRSPTARSTSSSTASRRITSTSIGDADRRVRARHEQPVVIEDHRYTDEETEEAEKLRDPTHVRSLSEEEWRELLARVRASRSSGSSIYDMDAQLRRAGSPAPTRPTPTARAGPRAARSAHVGGRRDLDVADDHPRGEEVAAMSDPWNDRAEAYRTSVTHATDA